MAGLKDAEVRLERALKRLEAAAARSASADAPSELKQELAAAKAQCERLEHRNQEASGRLNAAIAQLHALLGKGDGAG